MTIIDFDTVEHTNRTTQMYRFADVGQTKVDATATAVRQIDPDIRVTTICDRYRPSMDVGDVVFCCVDKISARAAIYKAVASKVRLFIDSRMLGEMLYVLTASTLESHEYYPTTLFAQEEAIQGSCTSQSTVYTAGIAAGLMCGQFTRFLRNGPLDWRVELNLQATEMFTINEFCPATS